MNELEQLNSGQDNFTKEKSESWNKWRIPMKNKLLFLVLMILIVNLIGMSAEKVYAASNAEFITEWKIPVDADGAGLGTTIKLPIPSNGNNFTVNWGDGTTNTYTTEDFPSHTYTNTTETTYEISITGTVRYFGHADEEVVTETNIYKDYYTATQYIVELVNWGEINAYRYGFANCTNLAGDIPLPSVKSFKEVTDFICTFTNCTSLTGPIPAELFQNAPNVDSFDCTFANCTSLTGSIPENLFVNNHKVKYLDETFFNCTSLEGSIPSNLFENTTKVVTFEEVFYNCQGLTGSIPASLFATTTEVTNAQGIFNGCSGLTGEIPANLFEAMTKVTNISEIFYECTNLTGQIPATLFSSTKLVDDIEFAFTRCSNLTGNLSAELFVNMPNIKSFISVFEGCSKLTGEIPATLFANNKNVTNFNRTFFECSELTGEIPATLFANTPNATTYYATFYGCTGLTGNISAELFASNTAITKIPTEWNIQNEEDAFAVTFAYTGITSANIDTKYIGAGMFAGCNYLIDITVGNNVKAIGTDAFQAYSPFSAGRLLLTNLTSTNDLALNYVWSEDYRTLPIEGEGLELEYTFPAHVMQTVRLNGVTADYVDFGNGTIIDCDLYGYAPETLFWNNSNAENKFTVKIWGENMSIDLVSAIGNEYITGIKSWGEGATYYSFKGCTNLNSIAMPTANSFANVTNMSNLFNGCSSITEIPLGLLDTATKVTDLSYAFMGCINLTNIPENLFANTTKVEDFNYTFAACTNLSRIPTNLFANSLSNASYSNTFNNCTTLSEVEIDVANVGNKMFLGCNNLIDITIGDNVQTLGTNAFMATEPYNESNLLETYLTSTNNLVVTYDWLGDNRQVSSDTITDTIKIVKQPEDVVANLGEEVKFTTVVEGNNLQYNWSSATGNDISSYTQTVDRVYKSDIEGQHGKTATETITLTTDAPGTLSFDYMVTSEANNDTFTIKVIDANGTTTVANKISGEVDWTSYSKQFTPNASNEIKIELTYSKNGSINQGGDYGAIRNLKYIFENRIYSTYQNDDTFTFETDYVWITEEESGDIIYRNQAGVMLASVDIYVNATEEFLLNFDYRPSSHKGFAMVTTVDLTSYSGEENVLTVWRDDGGANYNNTNWYNLNKVVTPTNEGNVIIELGYRDDIEEFEGPLTGYVSQGYGSIKNLYIQYPDRTYTFGQDSAFTTTNSDWKAQDIATLTIPAPAVDMTLDGTKYYCEISNSFASATTKQAEIAVIDKTAFITEWTIPVDADGAAGAGTTIELPIPAASTNTYTVDWGDGTVETFNSTANFPTHTYTNSSETTYEIQITGTINEFAMSKSRDLYYPQNELYLTKLKSWGDLNATYYDFSRCENLSGEIPNPTEYSFINITSFSNLFANCIKLSGSIPKDLFKNAPNVDYFGSAFENCTSLTGNIPETLFTKNTKATHFTETFKNCNNLTGNIPATLFEKNTLASNFSHTFEGCSKLTGAIPEKLFYNTLEADLFQGTFKNCNNLTGEIPVTLFEKNIKATSFYDVFNGCSNLSGKIPEKLFYTTTNASSFSGTFEGCTGLKGEIPATLFSKVATSNGFSRTFKDCTGLKGEIPATLFTNISSGSFDSTFENCSGLTGNIPASLFASVSDAEHFSGTFKNCSGLTGEIPGTLFSSIAEINYFDSTFENCSGLTGNIPEELLSKFKTGLMVGYYYSSIDSMFANCSNITTATINTEHIGRKMFYGCNKLTSITIGENVNLIGLDAFEAIEPYNYSNPLQTTLNTTNALALSYNWDEDNRGDDKYILTQPNDAAVEVGNEAKFSVEASGDNLKYRWYEVSNNNEYALTEGREKIYKSNIEGIANGTTTSIITIKSDSEGTLSFEYMVDSELNNDIFNISISDATGTTIVADSISGKIDWIKYSGNFVPDDNGEIKISLTYSKNASVDIGGDYGAIRNIEYNHIPKKYSTYVDDNIYTIDTSQGEWITEIENGETIIRNSSKSYSNYLDIIVNHDEEFELNFEYRNYKKAENRGELYFRMILIDGEQIFSDSEYVTDKGDGWYNFNKIVDPGDDKKVKIIFAQTYDSVCDDYSSIKNVWVKFPTIDRCKFLNDSTYTINDEGKWETKEYINTDTSVLTIPSEMVNIDKNGTKYYCEVYNTLGRVATRQALLTVTDSSKFTTIWTIPADADNTLSSTGIANTTITLPILSNENNSYTVSWGDGTSNTYTTEEFPTHTYTNTEETSYQISITGIVKEFGYVGYFSPSENNLHRNYYTFTKYLTGISSWGEINATRYGFSWCRNLTGTIPEPTENSFANIEDMSMLFYYCSSLKGDIPATLFTNATNVTTFENTFYFCRNLNGEIPAELFAQNSLATNFASTFAGMKKIEEIPATLFASNTVATTFANTFAYCSNLTSIPANLFTANTEVTSFAGTFEDCSSVATIPTGLFATNTKATNFARTFAYCADITEIPENIFATATNAERFTSTFESCTGITTIPNGLFTNNSKATNYQATFRDCTGLTGEINTDIFATNAIQEVPALLTSAKDDKDAFADTFNGCTNITSVVINTPYIGYQMFYGCNKLTEITINNNVEAIGFDAFEALSPYSRTNLLQTTLNTTNDVALAYVFYEDNRAADNTLPEIIFDPSGDVIYTGIPRIKVTVTDISGIAEDSLKYQWLEASETPTAESVELNGTAFNNGDTIEKATEVGEEFNLWVIAKDNVGNVNMASIKVVTKVPTPTLAAKVTNLDGSEYKGEVTNQNIMVELTSELPDRVTKYEWSLTSGDNFTSANLITTNDSVGRIILSKEIIGTVYFRAVDDLNNYSEVSSIDVKIDKTSPSGSINIVSMHTDGNNNKFTNTNTVTIEVETTDNYSEESNMQVALINEADFDENNSNDEIEWISYSEQKIFELTEGAGLRKVYILVKDEAGNQSMYLAE